MTNRVGARRVLLTAGVLLAGMILVQSVSHGERIIPHRPLSELPDSLGGWKGSDQALDPRIVKAVGVDDYLNRTYRDAAGNEIGVYVGYYESQRTGDTIHSPKNCLPGNGWQPVRSGRLQILVPGVNSITVNRYVVEKGLDRDLVIYWYQGRGRVVASEYWGKFWLVADAITRNRTDGCLVRLYASSKQGEKAAGDRMIGFIQQFYPDLKQVIPE